MPLASDAPAVTAVAGLGLGGNLGNPARQIAHALFLIASMKVGTVLRVSSAWRTPPWGKVDQPAFINACALVETSFAPHALLDALKNIERAIGRGPGERWGPRLIDIDILFYDDLTLDDSALTLPHRHLFERAFVLAPLAEIDGDRRIGATRVADALAAIDSTGPERLPLQYWPQYNP